MRRGDFVLSFAIASLVAACGGGDNNPDANLVHEVDAKPPDASPPDAFVCTLTECGGACVDTTSDPQYCGDCDTQCQSGGTCVDSTCGCIASFIPASLTNGFMDLILDQLPGSYIALSPFFGDAINGFGVGYPTTGLVLGDEYTLDGTTLPEPPFAIALYNIDIGTMMPEAAFAAVSGTLVFDQACSTGASGTLTDATFQAATIFPSPMIDPEGCTFTVDTVAFTIGDFTGPDCTPPA